MNKIREIVDQSRIGYLVNNAQRVKRDIIFIHFVTYYLHVFISKLDLYFANDSNPLLRTDGVDNQEKKGKRRVRWPTSPIL